MLGVAQACVVAPSTVAIRNTVVVIPHKICKFGTSCILRMVLAIPRVALGAGPTCIRDVTIANPGVEVPHNQGGYSANCRTLHSINVIQDVLYYILV